MIHIVTYATHSNGTFEELINNPFGTKIKVIGWGDSWQGYSGKIKKIRSYLDTISNDDIIVSLDGWDTIVNKNPSNIETIFKNFNCDILVSKDYKNFGTGKFIFGTCLNGTTANAGMYMGKVSSVKKMLDLILTKKCKDDQVNLNNICSTIENLKIDENQIIFQNTNKNNKSLSGIFVSFPASSKGRAIRAIKEYLQFFINYIILFIIIAIIVFPKYINYLLIIGYSILFLFYTYSDKSCY